MRRTLYIVILALACVALSLLAASCEQRPIGPETKEPTGSWKRDSWGSSYSDVWAASPEEFFIPSTQRVKGLVHYDHSSWRASKTAVGAIEVEVSRIWGGSPTDIYAVTNVPGDVLVHFDGTAWKLEGIDAREGDRLYDVWGDASGQVFAVGEQAIHRFDGTSWSRTEIADAGLRGVWGTSASDVFAVGNAVFRFDGLTWTETEGTRGRELDRVWGSATDHVYAIGHARDRDSSRLF